MERETTTLTVGSHKFEVKTYATALEANAIEQALFTGSKVEMVGDAPKIAEFNTGAQFEQQRKLVSEMVVKMDDSGDTILDRCLELPNGDFKELAQKLDEIVSKKK